MEFGDDVARLLLADAGELHEEGVIGGINRRRNSRHREREGARRRLWADARDRDERFEEFAFDRVREAEEREAAAVALEVEGGMDLERHPPALTGSFSATHGGRTISYASPPTSSSTADSLRSAIEPVMRENT